MAHSDANVEAVSVHAEPDARSKDDEFSRFVADEGRRLRLVLVAHFGQELGHEAASEALTYAWENWLRVRTMGNPVGYLYRVAQSSAQRLKRQARTVSWPSVPAQSIDGVDPDLPRALGLLSPQQRTAVVLVHGLDWTLEDVASAMGVGVSTLRNHLARGLRHLATHLGEER